MKYLKNKDEINEEYIEKLKDYILKNADTYFQAENMAKSFCDFNDFNSTTSREKLCMPKEPMLIDRSWDGVHSYCICLVSEKRKAKDLFKVIEIDELRNKNLNWRNGYFLLPKFSEDER